MPTIAEIAAALDRFAPSGLAADWDNVGLLIGRRHQGVKRIMTCLTVTAATATEAVEERADLVVSHHPFPFRSLNRITDETPAGQLLLELIAGNVAVYSPHTAFDSTAGGINQMLAEGLDLTDVEPLTPAAAGDFPAGTGTGRQGRLAQPMVLPEFAERVKRFLGITGLDVVGSSQQLVERVGIGCGSAGELLELARAHGCDTFVSGEMRFHDCLAAEATGMAVVLAGHYATERFAVERLAEMLGEEFPDTSCWASETERDPIERW